MSFPKIADIELPLLGAISALGGEGRPGDIYPLVAEAFPELTPEDQEERLKNYPSTRKWSNLVQWVRQRLVDKGEIDGSVRGIWKLTEAGKQRFGAKRKAPPIVRASQSPTTLAGGSESTLRDLVSASLDEIKSRLVGEIRGLSARKFEHFCRAFLGHLGYRDVEVTQASKDGGIDGFGDFQQGAVRIRSAFQAKQWPKTGVGRPEIDKFRGAIQGEYDHGVFLTTGHFTKDAKQASYKKGAITILLLDGEAIAETLIERNIGIRREPVFVYDVDPEFFDLDDD